MICRGSLPIKLSEIQWFRDFMNVVEPRYQCPAHRTVKKKLHNLANEENVAKWKGPNYTIVRIWTEIFKFNKSSVISTFQHF